MAARFKAEWPGQPEPGAAPAAAPAPAPAPPATPAAATPPKAPAATPEPTPATDPDDDEVPNRPVTRDDFKRLAQSRKEFRTQAEQFKKDHEAATARALALEQELTKTKTSLPANIEDIKKALAEAERISSEHKTLTEQLETINLERSPRFQQWWKNETTKHLKIAQAHVPVEQREELAKLLLAPSSPERDAQLDEILEPLSNVAKRLTNGAIEQIETLKIQREDALAKGSERYKELQAHEQAEAARVTQVEAAKRQGLEEEAMRRTKQFSAFQPTGDAEHDAQIPQREAFVRAMVAGRLDENSILNVPAAAVEMLHLREKVIPGLKAEIAKQAELIKQLQGSGPKGSDGRNPAQGKSGPEPKEGSSFADRVAELMRK
jgi:hypothetical protein